ncbi:hypothetical protein [Lactobacillus xujianguonis]|uniref:hypothetical protein n=1 Tax=Lactobacillus xujianguonis TaxID=2495899 RepID=UPI000FDA9B5E|nr:hypothetical protein [Lactobacillus xujianguonis]RVU73431.1 hypothetical protein EJK20_08055 [Lactobacillus xujianguonis]
MKDTKEITDCKQLADGNVYRLSQRGTTATAIFHEVKPVKAKQGEWKTNEVPYAGFFHYDGRYLPLIIWQGTREELWKVLKDNDVTITEV